MNLSAKIIVALDFPTATEALALVKKLSGTGVKFKIGMELFYAAGPSIVTQVNKHGEIFLDLKLHDIPETMAKAASVLTELGLWMFNVHASAGVAAMQLVRERVDATALRLQLNKPLVIGVTVLTSLENLKHLGVQADAASVAVELAKLTQNSGLDGVVCSPREVRNIKSVCPNLLCVTPGIRRAEDPVGDQARTATPKEAFDNGSDYLVIGRPITKSSDPQKALQELLVTMT